MTPPESSPSVLNSTTRSAPSVMHTPLYVNTNTSLAKVEASPSGVESAGPGPISGSGLMGISPTFRPSRTIYSPSETSDWLTCPVYRRFRRAGGEPRGQDWEPARLLGIAVQEGVNVRLRNPNATDDKIQAEVERVLVAGYQEQPKYTLEGLLKLTLRGIQAVLDADLFNRHAVLMVDEPLTSSRPDVVSRHDTEGLGVTDFKVSQKVDERFRAKRLSEYETDDQFWHYVWEVGESFGEPVKWFRPVVVILTPKPMVLHDMVHVDPKRLEFWLEGAEQHWADMAAEDRGERPVVPRWPSCRGGKFGPCVAYDFCHVFHGDKAAATMYYDWRD